MTKKDVFGNERYIPEDCMTCHGDGINWTIIDMDNHYYTKCPECGGEHVTHYVAEDGFHFKLVDAMIINVEAGTWFRMDEDDWVHSVRSHGLEIRISAPLEFLKAHLTKVGEDDKEDDTNNDTLNTDSVVVDTDSIDGDGTGQD